MPKACPDKTKFAGAQLMKLRRLAEKTAQQARVAYEAAEDAIPDLVMNGGAKNMEFGQGLCLLLDVAKCYGTAMQAHDSFRKVLVRCDISQPTDDDIIVILGGGGGGR